MLDAAAVWVLLLYTCINISYMFFDCCTGTGSSLVMGVPLSWLFSFISWNIRGGLSWIRWSTTCVISLWPVERCPTQGSLRCLYAYLIWNRILSSQIIYVLFTKTFTTKLRVMYRCSKQGKLTMVMTELVYLFLL